MIKKLSAKQKKFGREYMIVQNTKDAYIRAGYSEKGAQSAGSRLMRESLMQAFIEELQHEAAERNDVHVDEVIKKLRAVYDAAMEAGHYAAAGRAAELLGKTVAAFIDVNKNIEPDVPAEDAIRDLCTTNGVLNVPAHDLFMQGLELLRKPMPPRNEDPTQPDPEARH